MSESRTPGARYGSFDFLKGVACIAVVLIHFPFPGTVGFVCRQACRFAVPLFFLVSGFFFLENGGCTVASTARKLRHALWLCLGAEGLHFAFLLLFHAATGGGRTPVGYLRAHATAEDLVRFVLTGAPPEWLHLWFLWSLAAVYLFALLWFGDGRRIGTAGPLGFLLLAGTMAFQEFAAFLPFEPAFSVFGTTIRFCHVFVFRALPFFLLGIWIRGLEKSIRNMGLPVFAEAGLALAGSLLAVAEAHRFGNCQFYAGNFLMVAAMAVWAIRHPSAGWRPLATAGKDLSYYVYVLHVAVGHCLAMWIRRVHAESSAPYRWTEPLLVAALSLAFSFVFFRMAVRRFRSFALRKRTSLC